MKRIPFFTLAALIGVAWLLPLRARAEEHKQRLFPSPDEAQQALQAAVQAGDRSALREIFGPDFNKLLTGDKVQDDASMAQFAKAMRELCKLERQTDSRIIFNVGSQNWPFPIPLVAEEGKWRFDTAAGEEEIINRHIGRDELSAIHICREYVRAQQKYASQDRDGSGVLKYAQKFKSTPGKQDGLYWESNSGEESPFSAVVAAAHAEGYGHHRNTEGPKPYHGYVFRILTREGSAAPGGKYNYIINGNMIGGFALVAYPVKWGQSGIMTFIVNQQGIVYQRNLGKNTEDIAESMTEYNPDKRWAPVRDPGVALK